MSEKITQPEARKSTKRDILKVFAAIASFLGVKTIDAAFKAAPLVNLIDIATEAGLEKNTSLIGLENDAEFYKIIEILNQNESLKSLSQLFQKVADLAKIWETERSVVVNSLGSGPKAMIEQVIKMVKLNQANELASLINAPHELPNDEKINQIVDQAKFTTDKDEPYNRDRLHILTQFKSILKAFPLLAPVMESVMKNIQIVTNLTAKNTGFSIIDFLGLDIGFAKNYFAYSDGYIWSNLISLNQGRLPGVYAYSSEEKGENYLASFDTKTEKNYLLDRLKSIDVILHELMHGLKSKNFVIDQSGKLSKELVDQVGLENYLKLITSEVEEVIRISNNLFNPNNDYFNKFSAASENSRFFDSYMLADIFSLKSETPLEWEIGESIDEYLQATLDRFDLVKNGLVESPEKQAEMLNFIKISNKAELEKTPEETKWLAENQLYWQAHCLENPVTEIYLRLQNKLPFREEAISALHIFLLGLYKKALASKDEPPASLEKLKFIEEFNKRQYHNFSSLNNKMLSHFFHHFTSVVTPWIMSDFKFPDSLTADQQRLAQPDNPASVKKNSITNLGQERGKQSGYESIFELNGAIRKAIMGVDIFGDYVESESDKALMSFLNKLGVGPEFIKTQVIYKAYDAHLLNQAVQSDLYDLAKFQAVQSVLKDFVSSYYKDGQNYCCINLTFKQLGDINQNFGSQNIFLVYQPGSKKIKFVRSKPEEIPDAKTIYEADLDDLGGLEAADFSSDVLWFAYSPKDGSDDYYSPMGFAKSYKTSTGETGFYPSKAVIFKDNKIQKKRDLPCLSPDGAKTTLTFLFNESLFGQTGEKFSYLALPKPDQEIYFNKVKAKKTETENIYTARFGYFIFSFNPIDNSSPNLTLEELDEFQHGAAEIEFKITQKAETDNPDPSKPLEIWNQIDLFYKKHRINILNYTMI